MSILAIYSIRFNVSFKHLVSFAKPAGGGRATSSGTGSHLLADIFAACEDVACGTKRVAEPKTTFADQGRLLQIINNTNYTKTKIYKSTKSTTSTKNGKHYKKRII